MQQKQSSCPAGHKPSSTHLGSLFVLLCCCLRLWPPFVGASDTIMTVSSARRSAGRVPRHAASGKMSSSIGDAPSSCTSMASSASTVCSACRQTQCCTWLHKQRHQLHDWCLLAHDICLRCRLSCQRSSRTEAHVCRAKRAAKA